MREKIHRIVDLCIASENGTTHASLDISTHVKWLYLTVWEGKECNDNSIIYREFAFYEGMNFNEIEEQKINDMIHLLEEIVEEKEKNNDI